MRHIICGILYALRANFQGVALKAAPDIHGSLFWIDNENKTEDLKKVDRGQSLSCV